MTIFQNAEVRYKSFETKMETYKHVDKFGNPINIGDTVFLCVPTRFYPRLAKGKVTRFTPKQVEVEYMSDIGGFERMEKSLFPSNRLALPIA